MTDWEKLRDAYGAAGRIPDLLASAEGGDRSVWDDLWGRLCHQGTVYSASFAALPLLAELAVRRPAAGYVEPLHLAAAIIASDDGPEDPAQVRSRYAAELSQLRDLAERNLVMADGLVEFVYGLQALLSFEDVPIWQNHLAAIADEELEFECPSCHEILLMDLSDPEVAVRPSDDASVSPTTTFPADPGRLTGGASRMYALAVSHGHTDVAATMLHLLGSCMCPHCGSRFHVPAALSFGASS